MNKAKRTLRAGFVMLVAFILWTVSIMTADVQPVGQKGTSVGLATLNLWFFRLTGVHMTVYNVTDWLGLAPILVCAVFGVIGFIQLIRRKSLRRVDIDIVILGVYYIAVIAGYLIFEMIPINYRPVLIDGYLEASYPSSTTLLVLSVMLSLSFQAKRRIKSLALRRAVCAASDAFAVLMVLGRAASGVHWLTDIVGSILLGSGLFLMYKGVVTLTDNKKKESSEG